MPQAQSLVTVAALSAGAIIFSDRPHDLSPERLALLRSIVPAIPRSATPVDLMSKEVPTQLSVTLQSTDLSLPAAAPIGQWWLFGLFNWQDRMGIPGGDDVSLRELIKAASAGCYDCASAVADLTNMPAGYHIFDFWMGKYDRLDNLPSSEVWSLPQVGPRCCSLLAVRSISSDGSPQLVGTNVHASCGLELTLWRFVPNEGKSITLDFAIRASHAFRAPRVWIYLPGAHVSSLSLRWHTHSDHRVGCSLVMLFVQCS